MRLFWILVKSRVEALFSSQFGRNSRTRKKRAAAGAGKKVLFLLLGVYVIGCFGFLFGMTFRSLCEPLVMLGLGWLYFSMMGIFAAALCFLGSVFMTQQQIFEAKDNELLLSMPIPPRYILGSRMVMLLIFNYAFELLVVIPGIIVWCMSFSLSAGQALAFFLCVLTLPLLVMTFSCIFAWLLTLIMQRIRNKSFVTLASSIAFLVLYFYFYSRMNEYLGYIVTNGAVIGETVKSAVFPAYAFGVALADANLVMALAFMLVCIVPFALVYAVLSRSFIRLVTSRRGAAKIKYRAKAVKASSASGALLRKELRFFLGNGMYMLNAGMGSLFTLAGVVALVLYRDTIRSLDLMLPGVGEYLGPLLAVAICFLSSTDIISAPSVSLEGRRLWIVRSLPVETGAILMAKVYAHLVIALPPVILASVAGIIVLRPTFVAVLGVLFAPVVVSCFCALLGVVVNLHFPKLDFVSEVAVIKQSASPMITMLGAMAVLLVPGLVYIFALRDAVAADVFILGYTLLLALVCLLMYRYLWRGGARRFEEL